MQTLTCPIPQNINPLQSNGFMFAITKLPEVTFFCQEANIPEIILPAADMATPLVDVPIPGDKMTFGEMTVQFIIDEEMKNYVAVHNWMVGLGFPQSHDQYQRYLDSHPNDSTPMLKGYSDGVLQVLNSSNNANRTIMFRNMFPTSLQSLQLMSTTTETVYLAGNATFKYAYYEFT